MYLTISTVQPAKSDSDVMLCLQGYRRLIINRWLADRIYTQVIYRFMLAKMECTSHVLLNIRK